MDSNNNSESTLSFSLSAISNWQLDCHRSNIELPALQRGFVWRVSQIETLWDSLLRGFPVGSFLLSQNANAKLFLLDGQQRATSIAIGYYNPWFQEKAGDNKFWSLKDVPIVWIDLKPKQKAVSQKFVIRVVTRSHPWGYQRVNHSSVLSVPDRKKALAIFKEISGESAKSYFKLPLSQTFPYDADLPVPLSFLIHSVSIAGENWKEKLLQLCKQYLPSGLRTKHFGGTEKAYFDLLDESLHEGGFDPDIYSAVRNLEKLRIPGIVVDQEILKAQDEGSENEQDPTLFLRLNSAGTRLDGEELIYSIYKASFPEAKELVENIGASFVAPSLVISLVARLAYSEINNCSYSYTIGVNDFRKRIKEEGFRNKLKELIGDAFHSPAAILFREAIDLLRSKDSYNVPPVLVKKLVKDNPDLFLMLLQWIKLHGAKAAAEKRQGILATVTALSWFGRDNGRYVREVWPYIAKDNFWSKQTLGIPFVNKKDHIMYPLIHPSLWRVFLLKEVVGSNVYWDRLYPAEDSPITHTYKEVLKFPEGQEMEVGGAINGIWNNFRGRLFWCKSMVLFAQRAFINETFEDFNQMETLEDTNAPWDWDHIFPSEWVHGLRYIHPNTRHWNNSIGNLRAESLEKNRRESNHVPPATRLYDDKVREESFIKASDWQYWKELKHRINEDQTEMLKTHLRAVIHRMCNIYEEWYEELNVGQLFDYEPDNK